MIILIDFDGTCVSRDFPNIRHDIGAVPVLRDLMKSNKLIIFKPEIWFRRLTFDKIQYPCEIKLILGDLY